MTNWLDYDLSFTISCKTRLLSIFQRLPHQDSSTHYGIPYHPLLVASAYQLLPPPFEVSVYPYLYKHFNKFVVLQGKFLTGSLLSFNFSPPVYRTPGLAWTYSKFQLPPVKLNSTKWRHLPATCLDTSRLWCQIFLPSLHSQQRTPTQHLCQPLWLNKFLCYGP